VIDAGLSDKVVLITGANHGIGAATAKAFAIQGAKVFISYMRISPEAYGISEEEAKNAAQPGLPMYHAKRMMSASMVVDEIRENGGQAESFESDLAEVANIPLLFDRAEDAFGHVEILVNNAAHWESDTFTPQPRVSFLSSDRANQTITKESHDRHFAVNSRAVALMMAEFAGRVVKHGIRWGRIINISTDGASAFPGEASYGASKHAMESYSRAAACELGKYGITVNIVSPGPTQTDYISRELEEKLIPDIPLGRLGQPKDIADAIIFFASEQASWITGQLIYVGGGHVMSL